MDMENTMAVGSPKEHLLSDVTGLSSVKTLCCGLLDETKEEQA